MVATYTEKDVCRLAIFSLNNIGPHLTCIVATSPQQYRCPYCQKDMSKATETGWKSHLVSTCTKNPRMPK